ncbi:uncharacterized protein L3040_008261 [Drepanopeziza brunnea f. sp. 'multigermtubi']|uniref:uncharacterized protein n=1 Tax=Drepanopeziza brunnea f. sp. 'multigermtubi' TaxID=698441 RepID=UPI0023A4F6B9|nr:hypothetical protein L3040_008261 [Drepanopeziza brunnea f. sp. 'multigermtubi']
MDEDTCSHCEKIFAGPHELRRHFEEQHNPMKRCPWTPNHKRPYKQRSVLVDKVSSTLTPAGRDVSPAFSNLSLQQSLRGQETPTEAFQHITSHPESQAVSRAVSAGADPSLSPLMFSPFDSQDPCIQDTSWIQFFADSLDLYLATTSDAPRPEHIDNPVHLDSSLLANPAQAATGFPLAFGQRPQHPTDFYTLQSSYSESATELFNEDISVQITDGDSPLLFQYDPLPQLRDLNFDFLEDLVDLNLQASTEFGWAGYLG